MLVHLTLSCKPQERLLWYSLPHVHSLQLAQRQVTGTIMDVKGKAIRAPENRSHILLSKLGWMNIQNRINFRKALMIFKSLNNLAPQYMINMFNYVPNTVNTRQLTTSYNRKDLQIPIGTHKMIYVNSFTYSSVKV